MATSVELANLGLQRIKVMAEAQATLLKAYADYDFRMMEVLEKRVKVETDALKLAIMIDAFKDFKRARAEVLRDKRKIESKIDTISAKLKTVGYLAKGETLSAPLVAHAWIGLVYFLNDAPIDVAMDLNSMQVTDEHRQGKHFCHNSNPTEECESAGPDITAARALIDFLRKKSYTARIGSPPYDLLGDVMTALAENADAKAKELEQALDSAKEELQQLRNADWQTIGIGVAPKDSHDVT